MGGAASPAGVLRADGAEMHSWAWAARGAEETTQLLPAGPQRRTERLSRLADSGWTIRPPPQDPRSPQAGTPGSSSPLPVLPGGRRSPGASRPSAPLGAGRDPDPANTNSIAWADPSRTDITGRRESAPVGQGAQSAAGTEERAGGKGAGVAEGHGVSWRDRRGQSPAGEAAPGAGRARAQHPPAPSGRFSSQRLFTRVEPGRRWVCELRAMRRGCSTLSAVDVTSAAGSVRLSLGFCVMNTSGQPCPACVLAAGPGDRRGQRCDPGARAGASPWFFTALGAGPWPHPALRGQSSPKRPRLAPGLCLRGWCSGGINHRSCPLALQSCSNPAASTCGTSPCAAGHPPVQLLKLSESSYKSC